VFGCWVCVFVFKIKQGTRFTSECLKDILRDNSLSLSPPLSLSLPLLLFGEWVIWWEKCLAFLEVPCCAALIEQW